MVRKNRKNFLPIFIVNIVLWLIFIAFILKTSPEEPSGLPIIFFFILLTLPLFITLALLLSNTGRGFLGALFIDSILFFKIIRQDSFINIVLSAAFFAAVELFFNSKNKDKKSSPIIDKNRLR